MIGNRILFQSDVYLVLGSVFLSRYQNCCSLLKTVTHYSALFLHASVSFTAWPLEENLEWNQQSWVGRLREEMS